MMEPMGRTDYLGLFLSYASLFDRYVSAQTKRKSCRQAIVPHIVPHDRESQQRSAIVTQDQPLLYSTQPKGQEVHRLLSRFYAAALSQNPCGG